MPTADIRGRPRRLRWGCRRWLGPPSPPPPGAYEAAPAIWVYGRHGVRYRVVADRTGPDGCTLAESPVYLPDGRVDRRFVRVCPDYRGRYHIVD